MKTLEKHIIAMGGGGFPWKSSAFELERYVLSLTAKSNPAICFLPQASSESQQYVVKFYDTFFQLGAQPSWLSLFGRVADGWEERLLSQDIIYVGGGNTKSMLGLWKTWGLDKVIIEAYHQGIILAGVSAGAICWFQQGLTDSIWPLGVMDCLGIIDGSCCPHFDSEEERPAIYRDMIATKKIVGGYALDDKTAVHFMDGELHKVISYDADKSVRRIDPDNEAMLDVEVIH